MIITSAALRAINKGFLSLYMDAYQGGPAKVPLFAMRTASATAEEVYGWLGAMPGMRELIGEVVIRNLTEHSYSIANKEFESTIGVKRVSIERDKLNVYTPYLTAMGAAARQHPDELLANALLAGFGTKCYTGKNFFDSNHEPIKGKVKFSNVGVKKLSAANFEVARANLKGRLNAEGRPMNLGVDMVLIVAPQNEVVGRQILQADFIQANAAAVSNVNKGTASLEVWPLLAGSPDAWFLVERGLPIKACIYQVEKETTFQSLDNPASEHVILKQEYIHQAYGRYNVGYGLPELAYGSDGSQPA